MKWLFRFLSLGNNYNQHYVKGVDALVFRLQMKRMNRKFQPFKAKTNRLFSKILKKKKISVFLPTGDPLMEENNGASAAMQVCALYHNWSRRFDRSNVGAAGPEHWDFLIPPIELRRRGYLYC